MEDPRIENALRLLVGVDADSMSVKEAVEVIEVVTRAPELIRKILEKAEAKGILKKNQRGGYTKSKPLDLLPFRPSAIRRKCDDNCARCGRRITNCYFIVLGDGELGPLGSECIKRLRLRA